VHIKAPIVKARSTFSCDSPYTRNFAAKYIGAKHYNWDFGDGTSDTAFAPYHVYTNGGSYIPSVTVTDPSGC
jgi:PKD repeat protein